LRRKDNALPDNNMNEGGVTIAALTADLMFAARIRSVAPEALAVQSLDRLLAVVGPVTRLVMVDLQAGEAVEAVRRLRTAAPGAEVVAFGPHVAEAALEAARRAGADRVLVRSVFVRELAQLVQAVGE
jgi:DNA-binding NarL/FixJ family response regulator